MIRVLFISHAVELAGAEIALLRFIALLDRTRFEPMLLVPRVGDLHALIGETPTLGVFYELTLEANWDEPRLLRQIEPIYRVITEQRPNLVVVNTSTIPQAVIATLMTDIPLMVHLHAFIVKEQFAALPAGTRFGDELWLPYTDHLIACSDWVAHHYEPLLRRSIPTVPNTVLTAVPMPYPIDDTALVVMLASFEPNKRPELFIEAAHGVREQYPHLKFRCRLYGEGAPRYTASLHALIDKRGLAEIFTLHARVPDTNLIYQSCAVVFVPSAVESFSLVTIEAAAHQRPVIATRCGGPDSIVIDGETGFLIDVDDLGAAIDRLATLLQNPALGSVMGVNARQHYEANYAPNIVSRQYQAALEATLESAAAQPERRRLARPLAQYFMNEAYEPLES